MTGIERRAKPSAKKSGMLRGALDTVVDPKKQHDDDVTKRLNAVYDAEPEEAGMAPLLMELQIRSLREKW